MLSDWRPQTTRLARDADYTEFIRVPSARYPDSATLRWRGGIDRRPNGEFAMLLRKLAILPAALVAFGLTVAAPVASYAQSAPAKPAATKKAPAEKKAKKKAPAKKKAADAGLIAIG
jgi:hypothetical protein